MRGGAERVLKVLADMFPDAPIYTLLYDEKKLGDWFPRERVRPAAIAGWRKFLPSPLRYDHHLHLGKFPSMIESLDLSEFDLVISCSSAFAHGVITNGKPKHICYVNAPARYLWDRTRDVVDRASKGILGPVKKRYLERTFHSLRLWDAEAAARADKLIAASENVRRRIELYWRRESDVICPPIDDMWLNTEIPTSPSNDYFLIVSTLVAYKNIELAIDACNELSLPLAIVGEGPHEAALKKRAGKTIGFPGYRSGPEVQEMYANASAVLFPGVEDFGLVPLEAMACGTPVIAYRGGGALETVVEGVTGAFFDEQSAESLTDVLRNFDRTKFDARACTARAAEFSRTRFEKEIRNLIASL